MKSEFKEDQARSKSSDDSGEEGDTKPKTEKITKKLDPILEKYKRPTAAADAEKAAEDEAATEEAPAEEVPAEEEAPAEEAPAEEEKKEE